MYDVFNCSESIYKVRVIPAPVLLGEKQRKEQVSPQAPTSRCFPATVPSAWASDRHDWWGKGRP